MRPFKRGGRGVRRVPGKMNRLEAQYAEHLELMRRGGLVEWFAFDAVKLRLAENTFYTPDFLVMRSDGALEIHEVKGTSRGKPWVEDDAAVKIKVAASLFPVVFKMTWKVGGEWCEKFYE